MFENKNRRPPSSSVIVRRCRPASCVVVVRRRPSNLMCLFVEVVSVCSVPEKTRQTKQPHPLDYA